MNTYKIVEFHTTGSQVEYLVDTESGILYAHKKALKHRSIIQTIFVYKNNILQGGFSRATGRLASIFGTGHYKVTKKG